MLFHTTSLWLALTAAASGQSTTINDFVMWDYRDTAPSQVSLEVYHEWLLGYLKTNPPSRLVLYISSPCTTGIGAFYDPTATAAGESPPSSFVDFLAQVAAQPETATLEIEVFVDRSSFPKDGPTSPCWTATGSQQPSLPLPGQWAGLPLAMAWLGTLMDNASLSPNPITGFTLDPEITRVGDPGETCFTVAAKHRVSTAYQQLIDYLDNWRVLNAHQSLHSGIALEVDSSAFTHINVANFPLDPTLHALAQETTPELYNCRLGSDLTPNWRAGTTAPLIDHVYLEAYVSCSNRNGTILQASSFWRWQTTNGCIPQTTPTPRTPQDTSDSLFLNMTQHPGSPGPGTLQVTQQGRNVTVDFLGTGTRMADWADYTRVCAVNADGTTIPPAAQLGQWTMRSAGATDTTATGYGPAFDTGGQSMPYRYSELVMNWAYPFTTVAMADRIWLMFSAEHDDLEPFFGFWDLTDLYSFIDAFTLATNGSDMNHAIYASAEGVPVAAPPNWAIYDLSKALAAWPSLGTYPGADDNGICPGDVTGDFHVDVGDLLMVIDLWGQVGGDANNDGTTDISDLLMVLDYFNTFC